MTDRIAKKPLKCLWWKRAFGGLKHSVSADILGKWHQDFSGLVYQMISAYTVQMYTQHRVYVRKARQASCNLRKKINGYRGTFNSHVCFVKPCGLILFSVLRVQQTSTIWDRESRHTWQVSLIQTEMVNPNVKSCWSISGIWQAHMRPALHFLFSYDVSPASLAQLQYRCAVCYADGIYLPTL